MSIFGKIMSSIFGTPAAAAEAPASMPGVAGQPASAAKQGAGVDVAAVMDALVATSKEKDLDWRKSIVDVMKLLDMDSGLAPRRELAHELGYTGDTKDTATMNVWLHKQVMTKLAENGGKVPDSLKHS